MKVKDEIIKKELDIYTNVIIPFDHSLSSNLNRYRTF